MLLPKLVYAFYCAKGEVKLNLPQRRRYTDGVYWNIVEVYRVISGGGGRRREDLRGESKEGMRL